MPRKKKGRELSQRQLKVGEVLRHALAEAFLRGVLYDPDLQGVSITISEVRISPDLHNATAYISALGGTNDKKTLITKLNRAAPEIRTVIAKKVQLRYAPLITFRYDEIFEQAAHIEGVIRNASYSQQDTNPVSIEE